MTKLATLYSYMLTRARASGEWRGAQLPGGARLDVRATETKIKVVFSRREKPLGATELITFCRHCGVPAHATRTPADPAAQASRADGDETIWYVIYAWNDEEARHG